MKKVILRILSFYKMHISRGYNCRFVPSCSEYCHDAVEKYGIVKGGWMGLRRISKCHPLNKGGIDLVK